MAKGKASSVPKMCAMFSCMATSTAFDAQYAQQNMPVVKNIYPSLRRALLLTVQIVYRDVCTNNFLMFAFLNWSSV